ncbi:MAG: rhodanese-like domain-containing protein [Saprospiraceae bacterium]|jgi:phage shock protein E|nr:rhodanese-like domain-containing protein [Saprospiraceae bacterium]MBK9565856.1 rhodanese-like domain-containing protein [Saprospiraceae bacterium]MBP6447238.1 rhodanese-like domain-containing protein [Saprospiraceae bacterium]
MNLEQLITSDVGTIIDVRTPMEYMGGHVADSVNIPLMELPYRMDEIKNLDLPIIFCCASGNRSGQATQFCLNQGVDAFNGGPWTTVNYYKSLTHQI